MAKELPYFQFEPAEYLTKDISFCSLSAQGLFINICSFYWQRQCDLSKVQFLKRFNYKEEFEELLTEGIIDLNEDKIVIKFLDNQYFNATNKSTINSLNGAKGGRPKKQTESEIKPNQNQIKSESKGIREDKIIKEEIIENEIIENNIITASPKFSFLGALIEYGFNRNLVEDWLKVRKTKKATNTETAFNKFIEEVEKRECNINEILEVCVEKSWSGFKWSWIDNLKQTNTFNNGRVEKTNREIFDEAMQSEAARNFRFS
jgi:hypothetical protein